jgi:hypothetical protein
MVQLPVERRGQRRLGALSVPTICAPSVRPESWNDTCSTTVMCVERDNGPSQSQVIPYTKTEDRSTATVVIGVVPSCRNCARVLRTRHRHHSWSSATRSDVRGTPRCNPNQRWYTPTPSLAASTANTKVPLNQIRTNEFCFTTPPRPGPTCYGSYRHSMDRGRSNAGRWGWRWNDYGTRRCS